MTAPAEPFHVADLNRSDRKSVREAASLLVSGFGDSWADGAVHAWPDMAEALREVRGMMVPERVCVAAFDSGNSLIGWVGAISEYDGHVWELHPMVVREDWRRRGVGRALVAALEDRVRELGALTLMLGTDDEADRTSLGGADVYPDPLGKLQQVRNLRGHPFEFYRRLGFSLVGIVPDANGFGKPDIIMAKRVARSPGSPPAL